MSVTVVGEAGLGCCWACGGCSSRSDSAGWGGDGWDCRGGCALSPRCSGGVLDLASTGEASGLTGGSRGWGCGAWVLAGKVVLGEGVCFKLGLTTLSLLTRYSLRKWE